MKRLILLVALVMAMAVLAPAAFADDDVAEPEDTEMTEKGPSAAQEWKAKMIADYIAGDEASEEQIKDVLALRMGDPAIGWGAYFKLASYANAMDITVAALLETYPPGPDGYDFGELKKELTPEQLELLMEGPKNLGQLQKSVKGDEAGKSGKIPPGQKKKDKTDG